MGGLGLSGSVASGGDYGVGLGTGVFAAVVRDRGVGDRLEVSRSRAGAQRFGMGAATLRRACARGNGCLRGLRGVRSLGACRCRGRGGLR